MANKEFLAFTDFLGIDQSKYESLIDMRHSPFAQNFDTDDATLSVSKGYERHIPQPVPGEEPVKRITKLIKTDGSEVFLAIAGNIVYAYKDLTPETTEDGEEAPPGKAWQAIYTYEEETGDNWDFLNGMIESTGYIFLANGKTPVKKYNGETVTDFGTKDLKSDKAWNYLTIYKERLFCAGAKIVDPEEEKPNRLWFSRPFDLNNFKGYDASDSKDLPTKAGGFIDIGSAQGDRIVAIRYVFERVIIFCKNSTWYLYGTDPTNFVVSRIDSQVETLAHTSIAQHSNKIYYLTPYGVYYFGGSSLMPLPSARQVRELMSTADVRTSKACEREDKIYFSFKSKKDLPQDDSILVYDTMRGTYMLRNGFNVIDMFSDSDNIYLINDNRYLYRFNCGNNYDGVPIHAIWETPEIDMFALFARKSMRQAYVRGYSFDETGRVLRLMQQVDGKNYEVKQTLFEGDKYRSIKRPLTAQGTFMKFIIQNENGGRFCVLGFEIHTDATATKT